MARTREEKENEVKLLTDTFSNAGATVFVKFHGLDVSNEGAMRGRFRDQDISYKVVKKTLAKIALENAKPEGEQPSLEGELAVAWGDDLTAPAREVYSFQKELDGAVTIMGGIFEGEYKSKEEMTEIAEIPSLEVLRGMFANVINSPIQGLAVALSAVAEKKE